MAEIYPSPIQALLCIAILEHPMTLESTIFLTLIRSVLNITRIVNRCLTWDKLECAVSLRQYCVIDKDATVLHSAQDVLLRTIKRIPHEELAIGRATNDFDFQKRDALFTLNC